MKNFRLAMALLVVMLICSLCILGLAANTNKNIEITTPKDADKVEYRSNVEGNSTAREGSGLKVYVFVYPIQAATVWWNQPTTTFPTGSFYSRAYFGSKDSAENEEEIGTTYKVVAIITNETISWTSNETLPNVPEANKSDEVTVIRI